jgi:4-amino-4-deoxy-L-arabinose transferase-like glycosyltransferase
LPPARDAHPGSRAPRAVAIAAIVVTILSALLLFKGLSRLGLWDPHELTLADQGCRRAAAAGHLDPSSCGTDPSAKPSDLRSIVMVQSVALGFRLFGVSEFAGRLPLALWALAGVLAVTFALARLVDARAALFGGAALITMPMYLVQGRLILGDAATMGAFALALAGFAVAAFDREDDGRETSFASRAPWLVLGILGTAGAIGSRGLAVGGTPALAIGLAWLVRQANGDDDRRTRIATIGGVAIVIVAAIVGVRLAPLEVGQSILRRSTIAALVAVPAVSAALAFSARRDERASHGVVGAILGLGALAVAQGIAVVFASEDGKFVAAVGAVAATSRKFPTYDLLIRQIAHGAFPWSCFLPFAFGRALARPGLAEGAAPGAVRREIDLRIAALVAASCCYAVQTLAAPRFGLMPFAGSVALAVVIALVLRDLERVPSASLAIAIGTAVFAFLVLNDFNFEDLAKTPVELATAPILEPYGIYGVAAPDELRAKVKLAVVVAAVVFLLPIFFVWSDEDPRPGWTQPAALRKPIDTVVRAWKHPWHGLLILLFLSFEVCFAIAGYVTYKRSLRVRVPQLQVLSTQNRDIVVNLWWGILVAIVLGYVAYVAFLYARDLFRQLRLQRVGTIAVGGLVAGAIWAWGVMPAVADQFSPKGVFAKYREIGANAPIGLLGVNARTAAYDLGKSSPVVLDNARVAHDWLVQIGPDGLPTGTERRFLALRADHLAELNFLWRQKAEPRTNLPIVDGRASQIMLASNQHGGRNENPLERLVLSDVPTATANCSDPLGPICVPSRALECDLDGKLACVGWELTDTSGKAIYSVTSRQRVRLRLIYRVTGRTSGGWQIFIHVEQPGTATARKTSDHVPLAGKYPMDNWLPGDVVIDESEFDLEPNMPSNRPIQILTGFFSGSTRMPLLKGPGTGAEAEGARLILGSVPVR